MARGWERQADRANNPLFYAPGRIDAASYRAWLSELAVGWVAVPEAELDYASVSEAELVSTGLPYLQEIWSNADWTLYRVLNAPGLVTPGSVLEIDDRGLTIAAHAVHGPLGAALVSLSRRDQPRRAVPLPGCVGERTGGRSSNVPAPGTYRVVADFDGQLRGSQSRCG